MFNEVLLEQVVDWIGLVIAFIGVGIIMLGAFLSLIKFLRFLWSGMSIQESVDLRHSLMIYIALGLDFLIAKDVIVTLSLERDDTSAFLQLGLVMLARILLSFFVHIESKALGQPKSLIKKIRGKWMA